MRLQVAINQKKLTRQLLNLIPKLKAFNGKRNHFADYDTLIDRNYDNIKDFVIGFHGHSGTGIKK
jgi:hypothetical protein